MGSPMRAVVLFGLMSLAYGQMYDSLYDVLQGKMKPTIPLVMSTTPLQVDMSLTLLKITTLPNDIVELNCWLTMNWRDSRLAWAPHLFNNISSISIPTGNIWTPDIMLYNAATDGEKRKPVMATLLSTGDIAYVPPMTYRIYCPRDPNPSRQMRECRMKFGSWSYNGFQLDLRTSYTTMDLSEFIRDSTVELVGTRALRSVQYYPCCPEPYPDVIYTFRIRDFPGGQTAIASPAAGPPAMPPEII